MLPSRTFKGASAGPQVLITAGVHGDEFIPMLTVRELIRRFDEDAALMAGLRGQLTLVPVVNESAFRLGRRCGEDGLDLARTCPGRGDGSVTEQAAAVLSELIRAADFYVDLHTGGTSFCVWPLAGYVLHQDPKILAQQRAMAMAFGLPLAWGTWAGLEGRSLSVARDAGVPAIYVEYFGGAVESVKAGSGAWSEVPNRSFLEAGRVESPMVTGCLNVLRQVGALAGPVEAREVEVIEDPRPQSGHMQVCHPAPLTGFFERVVTVGEWVTAGQVLGWGRDVLGAQCAEVLAEQTGRVVTLRWSPQVIQGEAVAVVAAHFEEEP
jgi:predicted deacylase